MRNNPPPNYIFPDSDSDDASSLPDDITQLLVLITGAEGTPYSQGLWRLHLKMPDDYPRNPPKATFRTKIYHPNVEESTGAVCLETLKRDWDPKLTLKDILITISCLLIQPNPDSALNAGAGALIQEDYDAFSTQAKLMTRIHAPIPPVLLDAVRDAKRRGEDPVTKREKPPSSDAPSLPADEQEEDNSKENTHRHGLVRGQRETPKVKRPLAELYTSAGSEEELYIAREDVNSSNEGPIHNPDGSESMAEGPLKKSPKLMRPGPGPGGLSISKNNSLAGEQLRPSFVRAESDKENAMAPREKAAEAVEAVSISVPPSGSRPPALRKVSNVGSRRVQPRVGIRRL